MNISETLQTEVEKANQKIMDRYNSMVMIEMSGGSVHVTIGGKHFVDDQAAFDRAMSLLKSCSSPQRS